MRRRSAAPLVLAGLLAVGASAVAASAGATPVAGLTQAPALTVDGRTLYEFESLLHRAFGTRPVFVDDDRPEVFDVDCAGDTCGPLSRYSAYRYTFSGRGSTGSLLVSGTHPAADRFGMVALVEINHRAVACDAGRRRWLVRFVRTASLTLRCLEPT